MKFVSRREALLEELVTALRQEVHQVRQAAQTILAEKRLAEQARDFYKEQADYWKTRASKFIDQASLKSGSIESPVMTEPAPPPASTVQRIMRSLNVREIHKPSAEMPHQEAVLGVDEQAAQAAIAGVLSR